VLSNRWLMVRTEFFDAAQAAAIVGGGMIIGLFGSWLSVGRQLRKV
jgi:hypothetical protein